MMRCAVSTIADDTYVRCVCRIRPTQDATEFRRQLRDCFEHGITPGPEDRLQIFERVRICSSNFNETLRDSAHHRYAHVVCRWRQGVTAHGRQRVNYYAATTGKSGGQKAKLASPSWRRRCPHNTDYPRPPQTHRTSDLWSSTRRSLG